MGKVIEFKKPPEPLKPKNFLSGCGDDVTYLKADAYITILGGFNVPDFDQWVYKCNKCGRLNIVIQDQEYTEYLNKQFTPAQGNN